MMNRESVGCKVCARLSARREDIIPDFWGLSKLGCELWAQPAAAARCLIICYSRVGFQSREFPDFLPATQNTKWSPTFSLFGRNGKLKKNIICLQSMRNRFWTSAERLIEKWALHSPIGKCKPIFLIIERSQTKWIIGCGANKRSNKSQMFGLHVAERGSQQKSASSKPNSNV